MPCGWHTSAIVVPASSPATPPRSVMRRASTCVWSPRWEGFYRLRTAVQQTGPAALPLGNAAKGSHRATALFASMSPVPRYGPNGHPATVADGAGGRWRTSWPTVSRWAPAKQSKSSLLGGAGKPAFPEMRHRIIPRGSTTDAAGRRRRRARGPGRLAPAMAVSVRIRGGPWLGNNFATVTRRHGGTVRLRANGACTLLINHETHVPHCSNARTGL